MMECMAGAGTNISKHLRDKNSDSIADLVDCWGDLQLTSLESRISYKLLGKQTNKSQGFEVKYFLLDYLIMFFAWKKSTQALWVL